MPNDDWSKIKETFHRTLDLPEPQRAQFLASQDEPVRAEVGRLLDSHARIEGFIAEPIAVEAGLDRNSYLGRTIGGYRIASLLGTGGMGQVFLAEKEGVQKSFALKIIKRGMDTDAVLRKFFLERQILSRLENPFIAGLLDAGSTETGLPFFVMEYVEGEPITRFCDEHDYGTNERLELFLKVCEAVKYAHQNLIVHRDIKPSNILVTRDRRPKLLDFGIAKILNADDLNHTATATHSRMYTPEYASPEQISGLPITTSTDVYSLGVVLYELLSGTRPFASDSLRPREAARLVLTEEPPKPSSAVSRQGDADAGSTAENNGQRTRRQKNEGRASQAAIRELKGDLDNIVLKALRKEPERRYQSVAEFSDDIRKYLQGLPVSATADSRAYRARKFIGRHRFGTVFAALIIAVSGVALWQGLVANRERVKAEERFLQVRKLANNVVFDYQDGIRNLAGSASIRERMITDAAEYLDSLASERSADPDLQIELAKAYDRLGDVKSNYSTASVGNALAAREFYLKALELKRRMQMQSSDNPDYLEQVAASFDRLGDVEYGLGNRETTLENYRSAIALRERILERDPDKKEVRFRLMRNYRNLAVRGRNAENTEAQMILCQKAMAMSESFLSEAPDNAEYLEARGDILEGIAAILETSPARRPEAVAAYQKLIETRRQHADRFPDNVSLRQKYGMSYSYLGDTFFELNDLRKAIDNYRTSLQILEPLGEKDPLNEQLIQDTANIRSNYAYSLATLGDTAESLASYARIIPIFEEKYAKDATDKTTRMRIAMAKEGLAITYDNLSKLPEKTGAAKIEALENAIRGFGESLEIYREFQNERTVVTAANVDAGVAVTEVSEALKKCEARLSEIRARGNR